MRNAKTLQLFTGFAVLGSLILAPQQAEAKKNENIADYGITLGVSPFGGSFNFAKHQSHKTTYLVSIGGLPEFESNPTFNDVSYTANNTSTWAGFFVNHRPIKGAHWFRLNAGLAVGSIDGELENDATGDVTTFSYNENPAVYTGIGFGGGAKKGFVIGGDIGLLTNSGAELDGKDENELSKLWQFGSRLPNVQVILGYNF
ncbi:MAG: hypothetical protein VXZ96_05440 [Myxococcota bacterium]|nr:hypothetical protein [Myxococcota bacterium]